jgi:hypothetical protein
MKRRDFFLRNLIQTSVRHWAEWAGMAVQTYVGGKLMSTFKKKQRPLDAA